MKMKSLFAAILVAMSVTSCSTVKKVVYRIDVPQGNYLEQENIDLLRVGMTPEQVEYVLGTPMLKNIFETHRWDYVFIKREGYNEPEQRNVFVYFDANGLVSKIDDSNANNEINLEN
ncbi:outer membrane protein assembly factor BamE [Mannheimia sp. AT1]|uniref:Outer membrane protein assembly factor BamE n=1 Tax=Mannheimia cairinae TaxID=3025936 RepID=A0ABT5MNP2_9PAST|nr:outer membrane protein assembly factor BamE [Mannheimia cairinae]MDD0823089.1 outer membrane protein assembly factor BamE [Mannheimia cairinae]MDD0825886.1 outer membrane protein assembly factor BamE [Mannheimia cairinae]